MNVGGTANLTGGSVNALFLPGAYVSRNYTILSATGGLGGTTFTGGLTTTTLPGGFVASLSYTPTDVLLDLAAVPRHSAAISTRTSRTSPARSTISSTMAARCRRVLSRCSA